MRNSVVQTNGDLLTLNAA